MDLSAAIRELESQDDELHARIVEFLRLEYGVWTPEVGIEALELRLLAAEKAGLPV